MTVQSQRTQRRREALLWLHGRMGGGEFTTDAMLEAGRALLSDSWPPYTKGSFRRINDATRLGNALRADPSFEKVTDGPRDGLVDLTRGGVRVRSQRWRLREEGR